MRRSIATGCLSGSLEEKLAAVAAAGFDAVEIFESDLLAFDGRPREVKALAESLGLSVDVYQPFRNFEGVADDTFKRNVERAEHKFDVVQELGASVVLVHANVSCQAMPDEQRMVDQLATLAERASRRGLTLGYLGLAWSTHIRRVRDVWRLVQLVNHPHFRIALNSFHTLAVGDNAATMEEIAGDRIATVQIADAPKMTIDLENWGRHFQRLPGQGDLNLTAFVGRVLRSGYVGALSLEVFSDELRGASTRMAAHDAYRSLLFVEENVRRASAEVGSETTDDVKVALFSPPAAPKVKGVSFLEFAGNNAAVADLDKWLMSFGFHKIGMHRSKNVGLYRNGEVNLVLNAEPDSFAQSYYFAHGVSLCALGLRTDDAERAVGRALAYGCSRYVGRVGPDEVSIPAIRALDGSLIYFVAEEVEAAGLYETEFTIEKQVARNSAKGRLRNVDHIALALPSGELDSWVLFYRSVLGFDAEETWVLPDPFGIVRSRAMTSVGHSVRIPLNTSQGARTITAHSVDTHSGAGVHHVAFACADLIETVATLRQAGAQLLPIPGNYYDDLEFRFDLEKGFVNSLREANILYDRIGSGEFLHVYSEPFQDSFFFEFVQRIGDYDQYGATNASIRMAVLGRIMSARQQVNLR
ncbi:MAG: sugar phosphate isomerase/epimerase and 4-hydroxyphenylpyruvate domain-containing protein [Alphaproteobacteria bacterium]|nr:sugar phosphate isomerase/epimerase and 4-hydroxyphenylpyruvate domain-containing protein [Alphaproteobacteria bacterium]MDE2163018.1 sugar phosphate isomerase/epimerase and 4-hydroxyphenylpyruvate domain-containing protein [Alphaproteobacteria bacterium]